MIIKITDTDLSERQTFELMEKLGAEIMKMQLERNHPEAYKFLTEKKGKDDE